jgi:CheY-like chemotaxis protein
MARLAGEPTAPPPLQAGLAQLDEGVVMLDADGVVTLSAGRAPAGHDPALRALSTGRPVAPSLMRDHDQRVIETRAFPLLDEGRVCGAVQLSRDRSELARHQSALERADRELTALQVRLARSAHLRTLGDVAAGATLGLNNELNAITLLLPLVGAAPDAAQRARRLASVDAAVSRAAQLVDRLHQLTASRRASPPRALDLNAALLEALDLVRPELTAAPPANGERDRRVRVDARLGPSPRVRAQAGALRELLCSLLVRARDALPDGGLLTLRTRVHGERGEVELRHARAPAADSGELALAGARELAAAAGVELELEREGGDQLLRLRLPLAGEKTTAARPAQRSRRVLVVDDDADNREALTELLQLLGHDAEAVGDSQAALATAAQRPFDAALLDLVMPGMNGWELAQRLRVNLPHLRLALVTGWQEAALEPAAPGLVDAVLGKPLDVAALERFLGGEEALL